MELEATKINETDIFHYLRVEADKIIKKVDKDFVLQKATMEIFVPVKKIERAFVDMIDISDSKKRIIINIAKNENNIQIMWIFDYFYE